MDTKLCFTSAAGEFTSSSTGSAKSSLSRDCRNGYSSSSIGSSSSSLGSGASFSTNGRLPIRSELSVRCWMRNRFEEAQLQRQLAILEAQRRQAWAKATRESNQLMLKARLSPANDTSRSR